MNILILAVMPWVLINQQLVGAEYYCTYKAQGADVTIQTVSQTMCSPIIYK